jgi:ureidoglycolate hydrolase
MARPLVLENITPENFAPYGTVIDWTPEMEGRNARFEVLMNSEAPTGWRLAILKVRLHQIDRVECHPTTEELFARVDGQSVLVVGPAGTFDEGALRAFLLDRPVSLSPGTWHDVFALSPSATVLIGENLQVTGERAVLSAPIGAVLV